MHSGHDTCINVLRVVWGDGHERVIANRPGKATTDIIVIDGFTTPIPEPAESGAELTLRFAIAPEAKEIQGDRGLIQIATRERNYELAADMLIDYLNAPDLTGGLICVDLSDHLGMFGISRRALLLGSKKAAALESAVDDVLEQVRASPLKHIQAAGIALLIPEDSSCTLESIDSAGMQLGMLVERTNGESGDTELMLIATAYFKAASTFQAIVLLIETPEMSDKPLA